MALASTPPQVPTAAESAAEAVQAFEMTALDLHEDAPSGVVAVQELALCAIRLCCLMSLTSILLHSSHISTTKFQISSRVTRLKRVPRSNLTLDCSASQDHALENHPRRSMDVEDVIIE